MPIDASPSGTLDIENATLRSREIVALTSMVTGNDVGRSSNPPALEVYGDPSHGGNEARLELVSNTATVSSKAFTQLTSNAGVLSIKTGTDASDNGTITFGGFANERLRITSDGKVGVGTNNPGAPLEIYTPTTGNSSTLILKRDVSSYGGSDDGAAIEFKTRFTGNGGTYGQVRIRSVDDNLGDSGEGGFAFDTLQDQVYYERMRIKHNGNVGIGTNNPETYLHLSAKNSNPGATEGDAVGTHDLTEYLRFTSTFDGGDVNAVSVGFKLGADDNSVLSPDGRLDICANDGSVLGNSYGYTPDRTIATFLGGGNVGIGVTNPGTKLDVNGSLQSYSGRHVKTVPVRHNTYNDISGTGGGLRLGLMVPGQAAGYSGSYCAFSWFGTSSIHNFSADRWATPTRIRMCFKWGFVAGYIAYATFKIYETYYGGSDQLKATITSYNGSLSRGFTTVWGPDMTMQYGDVPGIMIVCDSNTGTTGATIRITDIWFEYVYI